MQSLASVVFNRYSIRVETKPSRSTRLASLTVEGFTLSPPMVVPGVTSYDLTVPADIQRIQVVAAAEDYPGAQVDLFCIFPAWTLDSNQVCMSRCENTSLSTTMSRSVELAPGPPWYTQLPIIVK